MLFKKDNIKIIGIYIGVFIVSVLILFWILELWKADLKVPFVYSGDALFYDMTIKGIIDNGWHLRNSFIGMPTGGLMYDFKESYNFHMLVIKVISLFTCDWASVMNIFFLLTFPLTTVCSFFVFRKFKISYFPSIAGSLLYTFLPYHFFRNEEHLILAAYYIVPLMVMVILWVAAGEIPSPFFQKGTKIDSKLILGVVICVITASSGVFYPFFACIFLFAAGIKAFCTQRNKKPFFLSLFLIFVIFSAVLIDLSPSLIYECKNGKNHVFAKRYPHESEIGGLKVTQLLLPVDGHRISSFAKFKENYNITAPLVSENTASSLGLIGSIGFIFLILGLFFRNAPFLNNEGKIVEHLSLLNIIGLLYGTIGGFGSLFAYALFSKFRGLNRISVFIAFFALFTVVIVLDKIRKKYVRSKKSSIFFVGLIGIITILGLLDQTIRGFVFPYDSIKKVYKNDAHFIGKIEASLPPNSMIFQLPYMDFPDPPVHRIRDYEHSRGYLHSKTLRWSYGTMRGRDGELWQRWVTSKPLNEFLQTIALAGFTGIYLDRYGYSDVGAEIEKKLTRLLNINPIVSDDNRLVFFDMRDFAERLKGKYINVEKSSSIRGLKKLQQTDLPIETKGIRYNVDVLRVVKDYIEISGWAFINEKSSENSKIQLGLWSKKNSYLINTICDKRPDVTAYFKSLNFDDSGFSSVIAKEEIEIGTYKLGIYIKKDNTEAFQYTDRIIKIER
jgi:phosphoglycerol transferase